MLDFVAGAVAFLLVAPLVAISGSRRCNRPRSGFEAGFTRLVKEATP